MHGVTGLWLGSISPALVEPRLPQASEEDDDVSAFADYGLQSVFIFLLAQGMIPRLSKRQKFFKRLEREWIEDHLPEKATYQFNYENSRYSLNIRTE
jgi:hypothetical protein